MNTTLLWVFLSTHENKPLPVRVYKCKDEPWILTIRSSPSSFKNHLIYIRKCSESHRNGQNLFPFDGWFKFSIFNIVFNRIFNFTAFTAKKCNLINIQNLASGSVFRESIAMSATEALKNADLFQLWRYFWPSQRVAGLFASSKASSLLLRFARSIFMSKFAEKQKQSEQNEWS